MAARCREDRQLRRRRRFIPGAPGFFPDPAPLKRRHRPAAPSRAWSSPQSTTRQMQPGSPTASLLNWDSTWSITSTFLSAGPPRPRWPGSRGRLSTCVAPTDSGSRATGWGMEAARHSQPRSSRLCAVPSQLQGLRPQRVEALSVTSLALTPSRSKRLPPRAPAAPGRVARSAASAPPREECAARWHGAGSDACSQA